MIKSYRGAIRGIDPRINYSTPNNLTVVQEANRLELIGFYRETRL